MPAKLNAPSLLLFAFCLLPGCADDDGIEADDPGARPEGRLLIMNAAATGGEESPSVVVYDLDAGSGTTLTLSDLPNTVLASADGLAGVLIPDGPSLPMQFVDTGVRTSGPSVAPSVAAFDLPTDDAWPSGVFGEWATIFEFSGVVRFVRLSEALSGDATPVAIDTGHPHFGFGAALGDTLFATHADEDDGDVTNIVAYTSEGDVAGGPYECPGASGRAALEDSIAFTCADGVLLVRDEEGTLSADKFDYPSSDRFIGDNFYALPSLGVFVGDYRYSGLDEPAPPPDLLRFDPEAGDFVTMETGKDYWALRASVGPDATKLAVLDGEQDQASNIGNLRIVDVPSWTDEGEVELTGLDYSGPWGWFTRLAVGESAAYISAPTTGEVLRVDLTTQAVERIELGGNPGEIAFIAAPAP